MSSFDSFKSAFKGDLVTPSDPGYADSLKRWAANAQRPAKIVAFVKDAEDASLAVKYAAEQNLPIAIHGGGHSVSGTSSITDGLVVDLSKYINGVRIDPDNKLAYIGGGAIWKTVDEAAIQYGLATVGGTVNHTGVGGLTLGGGYGWLSGAHGLTIDNLVQMTLVVSDGRILTTNENENSDLFWAARGSGSNFGVCTEFVLNLHEQRRTVYSGPLMYPPQLLDALIAVTEEWWKTGASENEGMFQVYTRGPPPDCRPCIVVVPFYNGSEEEGREHFKAFLDLKPIDNSKEIPYEVLNSLQNHLARHGQCAYLRGALQTKGIPELEHAVFDKLVELSSPQWRVAIIHEFHSLKKITSVSKNATAFNNRSQRRAIMAGCFWDENTPENQKKGHDIIHSITDIIASYEEDPEDAKDRAYGNYEGDHVGTSERALKLFGDNYPRLRELKKKYDPELLFKQWLPIQPAH